MTNYQKNRAIFTERVSECAKNGVDKAKRIAALGEYPRLYLHCTADKKLALLTAGEAAAAPETHMLLTGESLPPHLPYDNYFIWVYDRSRRAPIL